MSSSPAELSRVQPLWFAFPGCDRTLTKPALEGKVLFSPPYRLQSTTEGNKAGTPGRTGGSGESGLLLQLRLPRDVTTRSGLSPPTPMSNQERAPQT